MANPALPTTATANEFQAVLWPEEDGGFSILAIQYPGIVSQGETVEQAKANIQEAFTAMLQACRKRGQALEYSDQPVVELQPGCQQVWITVNG